MITYLIDIDKASNKYSVYENCKSDYLVLTKYDISYKLAGRLREVQIEAPSPYKAFKLFMAGIDDSLKSLIQIEKIV